MILLGVNTDGNFLLQNWWTKKQFVECSKAYLKACGAEAVFVNDVSHISSSLPHMDCAYTEAANVDHKESYYDYFPEDGGVIGSKYDLNG
jgi:hypothetical protein